MSSHADRSHAGPDPAAVKAPRLPKTREALLALHAEARARRNAAALGSEAFRAACDDIARIEVQIARIERALDPPLV